MRRSTLRFLLTILTSTLLLGCTKVVEIELAPRVTAYVSDNKAFKQELTAKDEAYQVLSGWMKEHQSGWFSTSGRYEGGTYIHSGKHGILVKERRIVIYVIKGTTPEATYVRDIKPSELLVIKNIGKVKN